MRPLKKYGVTERKKNEIDELTIKVANAEAEVTQYQAVVNSLTEKKTKIEAELATAKSNKETGLSNKTMMDALVMSTADHLGDSNNAKARMAQSEGKIKEAAVKVANLIDELIYTAELINKLSALIVKKKAINPLISDELVAKVTAAGTDANNAVALTLTALESVYTSQATNIEGQNVLRLETRYAQELNNVVQPSGKLPDMNLKPFELTSGHDKFLTIADMLQQAYEDYDVVYNNTLTASEDVTGQLSSAKMELHNVTVNLEALKASLAAAKAAALAS